MGFITFVIEPIFLEFYEIFKYCLNFFVSISRLIM